MADITKRTKAIDPRSKLIVSWFIRDAQKLFSFETNPYYNICDLIMILCLIYYTQDEYWGIISSDEVARSEDRLTLTRLHRNKWSNTSYGKLEIPSKGSCIYKWWFKIDTASACIGICDSTYKHTSKCFAFGTRVAGYYWLSFSGQMQALKQNEDCYGLKFECGDIIMLQLDTKKGQLMFYKIITDKDKDEITNKLSGSFKIEQNDELSYRICVTLYGIDNAVSLIDFAVIETS